jgi:hypothetical protein
MPPGRSDDAAGTVPLGPVRATVLIDDAPVTILPRRAPVGNSGPIRGRTLAVFPVAEGAGRAASEALAGRPVLAATVGPGALSAFALFDLDEGEAASLGRALGLSEILFWDGRRARLLPCLTKPAT